MSKKILIINNDPDMVILLNILIRDMTPYKTVVTNNPLEAIDMMKRANFSLVITEMNMPVMDGIEFLTVAKKIDEDIPVIIIASYGTIESALEAMHEGASDYITKPFRKEQILYAIDKALKIKKLQKENIIMKKMLFNTEESVCSAASY
jgi:DNA-binding NtrC family response regulator